MFVGWPRQTFDWHGSSLIILVLFSFRGLQQTKFVAIPWVGIRTPANNIILAWSVENKGDPEKAKKEKGELILRKIPRVSKPYS